MFAGQVPQESAGSGPENMGICEELLRFLPPGARWHPATGNFLVLYKRSGAGEGQPAGAFLRDSLTWTITCWFIWLGLHCVLDLVGGKRGGGL